VKPFPPLRMTCGFCLAFSLVAASPFVSVPLPVNPIDELLAATSVTKHNDVKNNRNGVDLSEYFKRLFIFMFLGLGVLRSSIITLPAVRNKRFVVSTLLSTLDLGAETTTLRS
jgi:hypothetical protein